MAMTSAEIATLLRTQRAALAPGGELIDKAVRGTVDAIAGAFADALEGSEEGFDREAWFALGDWAAKRRPRSPALSTTASLTP
jgi:hypothetical protein